MIDKVYGDPRLAAVYDALNPLSDWHRFFLERAPGTPISILDVGCGTGLSACTLARQGHRVTGVDPARAMLDIARSRPGGESVRWIEADAASFRIDAFFDLIIVMGHAFQTFHSDDYAAASLRNLRNHLKPEGRIVFDTRNPSAREWDEWVPEKSFEVVAVEGVGRVEVFNSIASDHPPFVTFMTHFRFPDGEERAEPATLRFISKDHVAELLQAAGLHAVEWIGDFGGSPWTPESPEIIAIATPITA